MGILKAIALGAMIGVTALCSAEPAEAGNGNAVGAALLGLGIGAIVGSALTPTTVYIVSPPRAYGPPPWSPAWYSYCRSVHGPYFDPRSGFFQAADGGRYFCR
jgi:hypothetical protein